jgi:hypothetical protein
MCRAAFTASPAVASCHCTLRTAGIVPIRGLADDGVVTEPMLKLG